ncbi:hypothetical protein JVT61DRAFT_12050 [Boletus reticuloceps]|uniref:Uncharacterized protein n=1 Tax=Boletus reticuloceps TaxID=495285 RepID=A0A8I2YEM5_9AGAM|nr:hypothetical protein JVT61DRAFT_12050 [Boletus reticuloceps]
MNSLHPRLLGSLKAMLVKHYRSGMMLDTLTFDKVHTNDPVIMVLEYVDVLESAIPPPNGDDVWWLLLPPSVSFKPEPKPKAASEVEEGSSSEPSPSSSQPEQAREPSPAAETSGIQEDDDERIISPLWYNYNSHYSPVPMVNLNASDAGNGRSTRTRPDRKGKKQAERDKGIEIITPAMKKAKKKIEHIDVDDKEDDSQVQPSQTLGDTEVEETLTSASKVCKACKAHGSQYVWSPGAVNKKQACRPCTLAKTRCKVEGLPDIRRPRGKGSRSGGVGKISGMLSTINDCVAWLEKTVEEYEEEKQVLISRISALEKEVKRLKNQNA